MKGIRAALCFHSALHSAPMLFFPWPVLPCAREEFDKVTPGSHYLYLSLHLPSLSHILIVRLAGLDCLSSHQWGHTSGLPFSLFTSTCLVIYFAAEMASKPAGLIQSLTSSGWCTRRNEEGQGLTVGTSGCGVLQLSALCSSFALSSLTTTFRECFLAPFIVKTHTPWPGNCTLTEYSSIQLSLRILAYVTFLNPSWSVLLLFKGPILFDRTKVTEKSEKHWGSSSRRVYIPFQHFEKRGCSTFCFMLHPETLPTSLACISRHLVIR